MVNGRALGVEKAARKNQQPPPPPTTLAAPAAGRAVTSCTAGGSRLEVERAAAAAAAAAAAGGVIDRRFARSSAAPPPQPLLLLPLRLTELRSRPHLVGPYPRTPCGAERCHGRAARINQLLGRHAAGSKKHPPLLTPPPSPQPDCPRRSDARSCHTAHTRFFASGKNDARQRQRRVSCRRNDAQS